MGFSLGSSFQLGTLFILITLALSCGARCAERVLSSSDEPDQAIPGGTAIVRGPYLQKSTPTSIVVRWRTSTAASSTVRYGTSPENLATVAGTDTVTTEHVVKLKGLAPATRYYYSVGTSEARSTDRAECTFLTAPRTGSSQPIRIWALGDSGTGDVNAAAVRTAYTNFTAGQHTDVWLMLGDNAYENGTDAEYQSAVFNMYRRQLRQTVLWPTLGNHDTAGSVSAPWALPYFQIFTLPTAGEAGGTASGTEKYYAFDHGNVHFINLDSMSSDRSWNGTMATWLRADLEATAQTWIIAYWHHPPYSKGSHDSDTELELQEMRENIVPILEAGGVDLVLSGHSHSYERSYLLNGHYGSSRSFDSSMIRDHGSGRENRTGAYHKPRGLAANQGTVYAVAGASGKLDDWSDDSDSLTNLNAHPAMLVSLRRLGSVVLDVQGERLDAKYLSETGTVADKFTILKDLPNRAPVISIATPVPGGPVAAPARIRIVANATDADGSITQVDFYSGGTLIGTDLTAPFAAAWNNVEAGNYELTAVATDNLGGTAVSTPVPIAVETMTTAPLPPAKVIATRGDGQVSLKWKVSNGATSYNVRQATVSGGPYTRVATGLPGTSFVSTGLTNGTTYYFVVVARNSSGSSGHSMEVAIKPKAPR